MKYVVITELDHVAYVKLHRPDVRNAFNPEMIEELTRAFLNFEKRTDLKVVTLSGEGKAFCAGADLQWMKSMVEFTIEQNREDSLKLFEMFEAIAQCSLPVIGHIHGAAFGGALGLVACCDHVVAEQGTQFCFSEVKLGIAPAVISSFVMRKVNPGHVRPLMLSGGVFTCQEAYAAGLVHLVAEAGAGHTLLQALVQQYLQCGPEAVRATKRLLNQMESLTWAQQKNETTQLISELRVGPEGQEGLKSFLERREPSWRSHV